MRTFQISDFREHQHHGPTIANRVWNAWWRNAGHPVSAVERHMVEMADDRPLPMAVVAHSDNGYLGSAFLIHSDMDERPQYSPWVAAVWVEGPARKRGVGRALIAEAAKIAASLGYRVAYICCRPELESFYSGIGWTIVEEAVGANRLSILKLDLTGAS
jgi:GNAT superfamily N-acetyltransferase